MSESVRKGRHFIGGEFRDSVSGATFDVISPVTEQPITTAARGDAADVAAAVAAAKQVFDAGDWSRANRPEGGQRMMRPSGGMGGERMGPRGMGRSPQ